jgi:hypothetical protein
VLHREGLPLSIEGVDRGVFPGDPCGVLPHLFL